MYPPMESTLKLVPNVCSRKTEGVPIDFIGVIGLLYNPDILFYSMFNSLMVEYHFL
jgi:hypothetical protein